MNKLSKTQRDQLIGIVVGAIGLMAALWYLGVTAKQEELSKTENNTAQMKDKLRKAEATMKQGEDVASQLQARQQLLDKREEMLAPDRDAYAWIIGVINPIIQARKGVNIYHYSQPDVSETGLFTDFPYKWATFHLEGTGYYHDFGKFFADLENNFPYFRIQDVEMSPSASSTDPEKIRVLFQLVVPVKPTDTK
jgi:Tfp pilus assembly protein PilO